jgi:hypothetical protein
MSGGIDMNASVGSSTSFNVVVVDIYTISKGIRVISALRQYAIRSWRGQYSQKLVIRTPTKSITILHSQRQRA